jgi:hypothetical protein
MNTLAYTIPADVQVTICPPGKCPGAGYLNEWSTRRRSNSGLGGMSAGALRQIKKAKGYVGKDKPEPREVLPKRKRRFTVKPAMQGWHTRTLDPDLVKDGQINGQNLPKWYLRHIGKR